MRSVENELLAAVRRLEARVVAQDGWIARLKATIAAKDKQIEDLEAEVARLKKDSSTSWKPPSSDIVKPPRKWTRGKRKIGVTVHS